MRRFAISNRARPARHSWECWGPSFAPKSVTLIVVVFKNNARLHLSLHAHGVKYDKTSEGALYRDGTSGRDKSDDTVPPGGVHRYTWQAPERSVPGPMDPSSIVWMHHSHTNETQDMDSGPIGPIIITRRGAGSAR